MSGGTGLPNGSPSPWSSLARGEGSKIWLEQATRLVIVFVLLTVLLAGCNPHQPKVIKIGLVAPFEGSQRYLGIDAIYAARLAIRELNAAGGIDGIPVELVAYDDRASSDMAADIVRNLATDPDVVAVVGHYYQMSDSLLNLYGTYDLPLLQINDLVSAPSPRHSHVFPVTTVYENIIRGESKISAAQDTFVAYPDIQSITSVTVNNAQMPTCTITPYPLPQDVPGTELWIENYMATGPHVPAPGMMSLVTYDTIMALAQTLAEYSAYDRQSALTALYNLDYNGYLGHIVWLRGTQVWGNAPLYYYCWEDGQLILQRKLSDGE